MDDGGNTMQPGENHKGEMGILITLKFTGHDIDFDNPYLMAIQDYLYNNEAIFIQESEPMCATEMYRIDMGSDINTESIKRIQTHESFLFDLVEGMRSDGVVTDFKNCVRAYWAVRRGV